jgi:hypothetical protein
MLIRTKTPLRSFSALQRSTVVFGELPIDQEAFGLQLL